MAKFRVLFVEPNSRSMVGGKDSEVRAASARSQKIYRRIPPDRRVLNRASWMEEYVDSYDKEYV